MVYPFHFNFSRLMSGLHGTAGGECGKRFLINIERGMLIGFLLCVGVIPFCLCLGSEDGSKVGGNCIESERRALLAIRADIHDSGEWLSSWTGPDCCQWKGVDCDNTSGHVVKLKLRYPYFDDVGASKLNPSISDLIHLRHLDLSMHNFSGAPIPKFIGSLMHLRYLNLSYAQFDGPIPRQIGNLSKLHSLDLRGMFGSPYALRAEDLEWLSRIPSLRYLDLSSANLSMATNWLHEINMHPSLLVLKLSDTGLPGIPATLQHVNFTSLTMLDLTSNHFPSAIIPHWLLNISSLVQLNLVACGFGGRLSLLGNLNHLKHLDLLGNQITGDISQSLWNNKLLEYLDLSYNQITGHTTEILGNLSQLRHLALGGNQITGEIPENVGNLSHLQYLTLWDNKMRGEIPKTIGNLAQLQYLSISNNNITGQIPENILNLDQLCYLELNGNQISGEIPENLGNLSNLQYLALSFNRIGGEIPKTIGNLAQLQHLYLSNNNITGQIPENISMLCNLQNLYLSNNRIGGEITSLIEGFPKCSNNELDGRSVLQSLGFINLSNNSFSGTIPKSLGQLSGLIMLDLSWNSFIGNLTEVHFSNLTRLSYLDLSYNFFKMIIIDGWIPSFNADTILMCSCLVGPKFPAWLQTQIKLTGLCLSEAGISDKIPSWLWSIPITFLNVSHNCMEGWIPSSLGRSFAALDLTSNCFSGSIPNLDAEYMLLSNNSFSGPIPLNFFENKSLKVLSLSHNHINGSIPQFLCNSTLLEVLDFSNNKLTGGLPDCWICNLTSLVVLDLSNNELSGEFSDCWSKSQRGNLEVPKSKKAEDTSSTVAYPMELQSLHMRKNSLSGEFPSFLRHCKHLVTLDLGENRLSGSIPTWIGESLPSLRILRLRSNFFYGNIPMQISSLSFLQVLDLACNNFSGNLPSFFKNFTFMVEIQEGSKPMLSNISRVSYYQESLLISAKGLELSYTSVLLLVTSIDLSHNNLSGEIPNEVAYLHGLYFLNLSGNHLIGKIPQNIGDMRQLESLDLSMNNLSGQIPQTMLALNYLEQLNLSYNNLSGRIPFGNQFLSFNDPSIYIGNHNLCGQPLPDCPSNAPPHQEVKEIDEDDFEMIWIYVSSVIGFVMGFWGFVGTVMIKKDVRISYLLFIDKICDWVYVKLAIKFARLKFIIGKSNYKHS